MLRKILYIMWWEKSTSPLRIIRKSYARYRKAGFSKLKKGIDRDYFALRQQIQDEAWIYRKWIKKNEKDIFKTESLEYNPLLSIIVPLSEVSPSYLKQMICSVLSQTYKNWELCIVSSQAEEYLGPKNLKSYVKQYPNIKLIFDDSIAAVSILSNTALRLSSGKYVLFMGANDTLAPNAMYEVVKQLNETPTLKLIYSDEDKIDRNGKRFNPHFKSSWNPDMLFSMNYISHLVCIQKELVDQIGGFQEQYEGNHEYDLLLRASSHLNSCEISRIEKVLYHTRKDQRLEDTTNDTFDSTGLEVLQNYFRENNSLITVENGLVPHTYKVNYPIPIPQPLVSLIIPTRDGYEILHNCVESVLGKTAYRNYEIIVIDNQTTCQKTLNYFNKINCYSNVTVISYNHPFNYSAINNFGVNHAKGNIIGLINNDVEVINAEWLTEMVSHVLRPEIGAVGAKLYYGDNTLQHAGVILGLGGGAGHSHKYFEGDENGYYNRLKVVQNYAAVTAACLIVRKNVFEEVGGLNEEHLTVAFNDVDLCLKILKKGYRNLWTPYAELYHHESKSRGAEDTPAKIERAKKEVEFLRDEHLKLIMEDPYYNKNLTRKYDNFGINIDE